MRLAVTSLGAGTVVVITVVVWAVTQVVVTEALYTQGERHLDAATGLGAERLGASRDLSLDSVAGVLALSTGYRVSVFDADAGLVAASSRRTSAVDGRHYLFSAARLYWRGGPVVIRFGAPVEPMAEAASRIGRQAAVAVLAAGFVALFVMHRATGRATGPLEDVRRVLARLSTGQPAGPRIKLPPVVELARVVSATNRVRGELEEQVARVSRERDELAQLMDEVGEGLMALTNDARILRINPAARALLGLVEVVPFSPVGLVVRDPVLRDLLEASVIRAETRLEVSVGDRELEVRTKRGTEGGSVVLLVDITEIRRLEAVRADFVANASHELKTPLTVIRAAAETVLDEGLPADLRLRFLRSIEGNAVRLQRLVDDLLDLSRYESGAWRSEREGGDGTRAGHRAPPGLQHGRRSHRREHVGNRNDHHLHGASRGPPRARRHVRRMRRVLAAAAVLLPACVGGCAPDGATPGRAMVVDGSSSLYPLAQAVTEEFVRDNPGFRVTVGASGTAGGLRRFCDGEVHLAGASRTMTPSEAARCRAAGLRYLEIPVARDGVAIVTNAANTAVRCLTLADLRRLWEPSSAVTTWRDLRPALPAEKIRLYGPGPDSGTLRFFTTVVVGRPGASRALLAGFLPRAPMSESP